MDLVLVSHIVILIFLVVTALAAIALSDLFAAVIVYSAYSFCMCLTYLILRSADVAITEAAVGAGVTTILFVVALARTSRKEDDPAPLKDNLKEELGEKKVVVIKKANL